MMACPGARLDESPPTLTENRTLGDSQEDGRVDVTLGLTTNIKIG